MRRKTFLLLGIAALSLGLVTTGCEDNDGPMEEAGESIDEAIEDVGDEVEGATDN